MALTVIDPATGEEVDRYEEHDDAAVDARLDRAVEAFGRWRGTPIAERAERLEAAADVLETRRDALAETMATEMGKPVRDGVAEVDKCAWVCRHYADHAGGYLAHEPVDGTDAAATYVRYDPLGPVLAVMPWNFPLWQVFRFAAPGLMAGNVGLLKHASNVPGSALAIEEVFVEAGLPEGCFQTLLVGSSRVGDLIADDRVRAVTLTGSEAAGRAVGEGAGRALKKVVLELGGSDPFIVLDDADVARAAEVGSRSRCVNGGQSCIAAKRFLVHAAVYDDFLEAFVAEMEALTVGDPRDEATEIGPQARGDLRDDLHGQVEASVKAGATLGTGGQVPDGDGFFYPPTVLSDVSDAMPVVAEETFGPVAPVVEVADADEAVRRANASRYGLGASVWTGDRDLGERLAGRLEAGVVVVNGLVRSDPRVPFGGVKASGHGRELGLHGIREFVNAKTVWVDPEPSNGRDGEAE